MSRPFETGNYRDAVISLSEIDNPSTVRLCRLEASDLGWVLGDHSTLLQASVWNGWLDIVKDLVTKYKVDVNVRDSTGRTCIHYGAYWEDRIDILKYLIDECGCDPNVPDFRGFTPLHCALRRGSIRTIEYLINKECICSLTASDDDEMTSPLHYAACIGSFGIVEYLIDKVKCDSKVVDKNGLTPLHFGMKNESDSINIVKYMIEKCNCDPTVTDNKGRTLLHYGQSSDVIKYLIEKCNCDPTVTDNKGMTPLHYGQSSDVIKYLIEKYNCDPTVMDDKGMTPLHHAAENNNISVVKYLIKECNCDPMVTDELGMTPLHHAAENNNISVVQYLIKECNCDPMVTDEQGMTPLHHAAKYISLIKYLICNGYCGDLTKSDNTPLHTGVFLYLINECNCNPYKANKNGKTPTNLLDWTYIYESSTEREMFSLFDCLVTKWQYNPGILELTDQATKGSITLERYSNILQYLINECSYHLSNETRAALLRHSASKASIDVFLYLIKDCKCKPLWANNEKDVPPLYYPVSLQKKFLYDVCNEPKPFLFACLYNDTEEKVMTLIQYLIKNVSDYDVNKEDNWDRMTLLHHAANRNYAHILRYLNTECNCNLNVTNKKGMTPLHIAVQQGALAAVEFLLSTGKCDPLAKDEFGKTPLDLASYRYENELRGLFGKFGNVTSSHPVHSYVNVLILGNPGAGKSTLSKVISDTSTGFTKLSFLKKVKEVKPCTAGIIPTKLQHKQLGNIILHDFAGHSEYYSSHTAVIENLLQGLAGVFVLVVNAVEKEALKHLHQWLTVVRNETQKAIDQCHIIIIVSHLDEMEGGSGAKRKLLNEMKSIITTRCPGEEIYLLPLDCRKLGGTDLVSFFKTLSSKCQSIRNTSGQNLTLYCHMMYGLLEEREQNVFTLSEIMCLQDDKYVVPQNEEDVLKVLLLLHSTGLICLLRGENKVWVIVNKQILLTDVNGVIFAPENFTEHRSGIASNTGIIKVSSIEESFPDVDYDAHMIVSFLKNMTLCHEIHPDFIQTTNLNYQLAESKGLLFFPGLLNIDRPDEIAKPRVYQFGWCLQSIEDHHFFPSRFFNILSIRLAFKLALPEVLLQPSNVLGLNRQCTFWRNGIYWSPCNGIDTLVEIVNESQHVLVLMSSKEGYQQNMAPARRDVIREIMTVHKESYPSLVVEEFLFDPKELIYPIDNPSSHTLYSVKRFLQSLKKSLPFVNHHIDKTKSIELMEILPEESLDCRNLSILGERDLEELIPDDNTQMIATSTVNPPIPKIHLPDIAYKVMTENTSSIIDSLNAIGLETSANKMLEKHIITEEKKSEILDSMTRSLTRERLGILLDILKATVKIDGTIFTWFIKVLKDDSTVLSTKTAEDLEAAYEKLSSEQVEQQHPVISS